MLLARGIQFSSMAKSELLAILSQGFLQCGLHSYVTDSSISASREKYSSLTVKELKDECRRNGLPIRPTKPALIDVLLGSSGVSNDTPISVADSDPEPATNDVEVITLSDSSSSIQKESPQIRPKVQDSRKYAAVRRSNSLTLSDHSVESLTDALGAAAIEDTDTDKESGGMPYRASEMIRTGKWDVIPRDIRIYNAQPNDIDERLISALQNSQLYRRILLLEPVSLEECCSLFPAAKISTGSMPYDRRIMRTWLDTQGICYFE